jgi:hypothetical protein
MVDLTHDEIPRITITEKIIDAALAIERNVQVHRTRTSPVDTLSGIIGEFAFAEWYYGDWRQNEVGETQGSPDFEGRIEVKTSVFPLSERLNLPIREDYAKARTPDYYVWCCIDVPSRSDKRILPGREVAIVGWATGEEAHNAPLMNMGWVGSYKCHLTPVPDLHSMDKFSI